MKSKKVFLCLLSVVFVCSLFLGACSTESDTASQKEAGNTGDKNEDSNKDGAAKPKQGGNLIIGVAGAPTLFNGLYSSDTSSGAIEGFIYNTLNDMDPNGKPVPDLAKSWEQSDDGLIWTFHLRDDVKWHDGKPFTADDVVFTYSIPLSDDYDGPRGSYFESIKKVEAVDRNTVKLTLKHPNPQLLARTTGGYGILPKHILKDVPIADLDKADFNTKNPIGTGPFKFEEWKQGQYVKVVANDDYFEGRPYLDSITYKIVPDQNAIMTQFQAGDIDFLGVSSGDMPSAQALVEQGKAQIKTTVDSGYTYIGYNLRNPLFKDKKVRQALTYALDRKTIVDTILDGDGKVANSPGLPFMSAFNEDVPQYDYDPEKAKQLLAEAGWKDTNGDGTVDKDGKEFLFSLKTNQGNKVREQLAQIAQQQWKEIGIKAEPQIVEWSAFIDEVHKAKYDVCILGWSVSLDPGLINFFHTDQIKNGNNYGAYSNPELDKLLEKSSQATDREKRDELIEKEQAIIAEDLPYTFVYYPNNHLMFNPKLHNVQLHPTNSYYKINTWWLEQ